ncbi:MAG: CBS domain-containing protein [Chloroflexi bacterium]|nr:CBS domain-containing protein [Chloroflexota bacterium]
MTTRTRLTALARDIMSAPPIAVQQDTPMSDVAKLMIEHNIGAVPVVTESGNLVGMITERIFQAELAGIRPVEGRSFQERTLLHLFDGDLAEELRAEQAFARDRMKTAGEMCITEVTVVVEDDPLWRVSNTMFKQHASHAVVIRGEAAIGIIARHDLLKVFAESEE